MINQARLVESTEIPYIWVYVKPLIKKALDQANGELLASDVLKLLLDNEQYLFICTEDDEIVGAMIGEIIFYPQKKIFRIITWATKSGWDHEKWEDSLEIVKQLALRQGCDSLEAWVRKGFAKKLKWDNEYSVITKTL